MTLITLDELARGTLLLTLGGLSGLCATVIAPGSALWLLPAAVGVAGGAFTVPEVRQEVRRALPGLNEQRRQLLASTAQLVRRPAPAQETLQARQSQRAVQQAAPADELIEALESTPHRLIIGHTRGGKTTLIHHMATNWAAQGERVLVADPDAAPGLWPGCTVRGAGDDIESIGELLGIVATEVEARRLARAQGVRRFEPLHLVIDEAQDVLPALDGGLELFEDVARRGGKLNIRMTIGVQDKMVGTLGLKGKSEVLRNLQVVDVLKNRDGRRVAVLRDAETGEKVSMPIPQLADPESLITVTRPATTTTTDLRSMPTSAPVRAAQAAPRPADPTVAAEALDLLGTFLAEPVPIAAERTGTVLQVPGSGSGVTGTEPGTGTRSDVVVTPRNGDVHVHVSAQASAGRPPAPGRRSRGRGLDVRARRRRAANQQRDNIQRAYHQAGADGIAFKQVFAQLRGSKDVVFPAWQAGRRSASTFVGHADSNRAAAEENSSMTISDVCSEACSDLADYLTEPLYQAMYDTQTMARTNAIYALLEAQRWALDVPPSVQPPLAHQRLLATFDAFVAEHAALLSPFGAKRPPQAEDN